MNTVSQPTGQLSPHRVVRDARAPKAGMASPALRFLAKMGSGILSAVKWIVIAILTLLTALFIGISLFAGPTPLVVSLLLALGWIGLLAMLVMSVTRYHSSRMVFGGALGLLVLGAVTVVASQLSAYTPPIVDEQGKVVPGSIASLEKVRLGGSDEWISVRGNSTGNPVLLFLAGGPGGSQMATARYALADLEKQFVVVEWDQPGAGKSFDAVRRATLTPERYISDAHELVLYLKQRFDEEKIYVIGESWGSALGVMLVQRYPELFHAFMGTGQMVAFLETDLMCYDFSMKWAHERGDTRKIDQLTRQGPPPYYGSDVAWKQISYLGDTLNYMNDDPAIYDSGNTIQDILSPEYGLYDKVNWARGILDTLNVVYPQLWNIDFRKQAAKLDVPVYFMIGRHDINAPVSLTEDYYRVLAAPHKEIIWFEHSGHTPWVREPETFSEVVVNKVLADTYTK